MPQRITRRRFVQAASVTAATLASSRLLRGATPPSSARRVNVAHIGVGGKGRDDLAGVTEAGGNVVALCDVDAGTLASAAKAHPEAKTWTDWREMLDEQKDIDAVVVTTPDHTHAHAALRAIRMGKHVYCQKPLTHGIYEARLLTGAAREHKVATQMGNQGHASDGRRQQVDWIKQGVIGLVKEVHIWTNRPIWPQGQVPPTREWSPPASLNWDLWLGPAPHRPYAIYGDSKPVYHPFNWRGWWDFGTGALGDMACHLMDAAFWALDLSGPCTVEAVCDELTRQTAPKWSVITYQFPARGNLPPVKMVWYDGGKLPEQLAGLDLPERDRRQYRGGGSLFVGEKGMMIGSSGGPPRVFGEVAKGFEPPAMKVPKSPGHYVEWVQACREGKPELALANFDYAGPLTETVLLGNVALRAGKRIEWDPKGMKCVNAPEADPYVRREYRKGWEL